MKAKEQRILSVWWPRLAIERWSKTSDFAPDAPVVLTVEGAHGPVISAVTQAAAANGARPGARLTDARALDPSLVAVPADPAGDAALVERLARWASRWSPLVEVDGADGLRMDVTGVAHLFGGEAALVEDVRARFAGLGLTVRTAVAPTPGAAWALARFGPKPSPLEGEGDSAPAERGEGCAQSLDHSPHPPTASGPMKVVLSWEPVRRVPPSPSRGEGLAARLAPLPVAALRLPPVAVQTLERLGLKTIGALAGVPRRALARRFRETAAKNGSSPNEPGFSQPIDALDRALGRKPEPLIVTACEAAPEASFGLAEPAADPVMLPRALARLAEPLVRELGRRRLGARRIAFLAFRVDGEVGEVAAETALPTRDPAHIVRLLGDKVQTLDPGFGFDGFKLVARWCEPLDAAQDALLGEPPRELELARLIDRLTARLGAQRVRRPRARESHLPEAASGWVSAIPPRNGEGDHAKHGGGGSVRVSGPPPPPTAVPLPLRGRNVRPHRLLDSPEAIAVIYATPEGVPRRFVWRRGVHDIARVEGPERIAPEWWRAPSKARLRDYYRVEDSSGRRFWIYREGVVGDGRGGAPAWYLHGLFG